MATSNFKESGKYNQTCVWRREGLKYLVSGSEDHFSDSWEPLCWLPQTAFKKLLGLSSQAVMGQVFD